MPKWTKQDNRDYERFERKSKKYRFNIKKMMELYKEFSQPDYSCPYYHIDRHSRCKGRCKTCTIKDTTTA